LHSFITSPKPFRDLLLAQREPCSVCSDAIAAPQTSTDDITARALSAQDYFLLVGPPGTGKTSRALRSLVEGELAASPETELLLMSYTNRAVDEICAMLTDAGINYLRIGSPYRCDPRFHDRLFANAVGENATLAGMKQLLTKTRVIVGTTTTMSSQEELFRLKHFTLAIIDEASQILEPDIVGLLSQLHIHHQSSTARFILIGDHKQLPAVVQQSINDSRVEEQSLQDICLDNCRNSLFERLLRIERRAGREQFIGILHKQGRMHPDIAAFPCRMFYAREDIVPVPLEHQSEPSDPHKRLIYIPSDDCREPGRSDKVNVSEAAIVRDQLKRIYEEHHEDFSPQQTVGVIVPYRNQIAVIRREIESLGIPPLEQISIDTVERYQGSQRDVIIYSFTIQNPYQLDFLTANCFEEDGMTIDRKLNVALTRARNQLIITGNRRVICRNPIFKQLIDSMECDDS
jgi:superfamily I DNA and/or RNA helicase